MTLTLEREPATADPRPGADAPSHPTPASPVAGAPAERPRRRGLRWLAVGCILLAVVAAALALVADRPSTAALEAGTTGVEAVDKTSAGASMPGKPLADGVDGGAMEKGAMEKGAMEKGATGATCLNVPWWPSLCPAE